MNRVTDYKKLKLDIVNWISQYLFQNPSIKSLVVGVSGGIDSAVVSTLCAETGMPTYVLSMPLHSSSDNNRLSDDHAKALELKYPNVTRIHIELSDVYDKFMYGLNSWTNSDNYTRNELANANTKSRLRMVTLYQIAGSVSGSVVGTGNKVEDYGVGFYTKYGDGGVDIAPIADLYKTEVWELGKELGVDQRIIDAPPTDGLWTDGRSDEDQIGTSYEMLEWVMEKGLSEDPMFMTEQETLAINVYQKFNTQNKHKMLPIPTFKL
jgi:NAD+ synthase